MKNETPTHARRFVYLATAVTALGGMLFGYDSGVISGAILFIKKDFSLSPGLEGIVVSSVLLGSLIGALAGGILADRLGRRRLLIITAAVFGLGAVGAAVAPSMSWLVASLPLSRRCTFPRLRRLTFVESLFRSINSPSPAESSFPTLSTTPLPGPSRGVGCSLWGSYPRQHLESD